MELHCSLPGDLLRGMLVTRHLRTSLPSHAQGITQVIDAERGRVENIASFRLAGAVDGYLNVEGMVQPAEPSASGTGAEAVRVNVRFTAFSLKIGALPALKIPLGWSNPTVNYFYF